MSVKAVIFDLDGTITEPCLDFNLIRQHIGLDADAGPILEAMEKMSSPARVKAEEVLYRHEQKAIEQSSLNDGAKEVLEKLRLGGMHIGVLTRNKRASVMAIAAKHQLRFDAVIGREDGPVKPDAFGIERLCEQFGVTPAETVMVGDYLFDLLCARAAGAIAVLLKNHAEAAGFADHADYVIENLSEVLDIAQGKEGQ